MTVSGVRLSVWTVWESIRYAYHSSTFPSFLFWNQLSLLSPSRYLLLHSSYLPLFPNFHSTLSSTLSFPSIYSLCHTLQVLKVDQLARGCLELGFNIKISPGRLAKYTKVNMKILDPGLHLIPFITYSPTHAQTHSLSLSLSHTCRHTHTLSLSLTHTHCCPTNLFVRDLVICMIMHHPTLHSKLNCVNICCIYVGYQVYASLYCD